MQMMKSVPKAADVMDIMHLIYKTYHYSPKSKRVLKKLGEELGINVCNPTRVKGTRWSPHIEKALRILLRPPKTGEVSQYAVIYQHMEHLASTSTNADVKGRAKNVSQKMKDFSFVSFAHFLLDLLGYITALSLSFQSNRTILSSAVNGIKACMTGVEAPKDRAKHAGFLEGFFANDSLRAFVPSFQEIELKNTQGVDFGNLSMEDMSLSFRNAVSRAVDLVVNGMRYRYASLLDHGNGGDPCAASAVRK